MKYMYYFVYKFYDILEDFIDTFTFMSGKQTIFVLGYAVMFLLVSLIGKAFERYTFLTPLPCVILVLVSILLCILSGYGRSDVEKFKEFLNGTKHEYTDDSQIIEYDITDEKGDDINV